MALGAGDLGLPGAGDLGRPGGTGDFDWPATAGDGDLGLPGPGDLGRGGLVPPPAGWSEGALNEPMPNGSSDCNSSSTTTTSITAWTKPTHTHRFSSHFSRQT